MIPIKKDYLEKGEYELIKNETEFSYGGSDSCKGIRKHFDIAKVHIN